MLSAERKQRLQVRACLLVRRIAAARPHHSRPPQIARVRNVLEECDSDLTEALQDIEDVMRELRLRRRAKINSLKRLKQTRTDRLTMERRCALPRRCARVCACVTRSRRTQGGGGEGRNEQVYGARRAAGLARGV